MSHRLQVLIPETLDGEIKKAASRRRFSKGEWVRRVIVDALERERTGGDPLSQLASLDLPTADIDQMLGEIETGRTK